MWNLVSRLLPPSGVSASRRLWNLAADILRLPAAEVAEVADEDLHELRRRMEKPQRHRLLHGYPLAQAMPRRGAAEWEDLRFVPGRRLLLGVLPHPFCNPTVVGCGFCTFPHQPYHGGQAADLVAHVLEEVEQRLRFQPSLRSRRVDALYFGGGTANLTPAEPFAQLCRGLACAFDLTQAEATLEGVPAYFVKRRPLLMDLMREAIPARHFRISMGIQTFDEGQLRRMGRLAFGTADTFREVVREAHRRGFTVSADLLFNLPGQSLPQMRDDLARAIDLGLDHLGLYHLVLFRGLGTAWSADRELLAQLPSNEQAAEHWLQLRDFLLENGFYQTTLTNFERQQFRGQPPRFIYEEHSFQPDQYDVIGVGPSGISFAADPMFRAARKVLNPESAAAYTAAVKRGAGAWDRSFAYGPRDLHVFYLTRRLAALAIDRRAYRSLFGVDPLADFGKEFRALAKAGLVEIAPRWLRPTPLGMFYADSIAALLAWRRIRSVRRQGNWGAGASKPAPAQTGSPEVPALNNNDFGHM